MTTKYKKHHRIIATVFLLIFFPTLVPSNLFASNNGPKSPEAASFEPVDATDMVNLITGQYSYVLPLLNVPSPEGGYPIALGYHAGIALDQEASWAGLGWNVNPGAIDRNINGYPDDYNASSLDEYFWDRSHTETTYTASVGYTNGIISVGTGFNWGSNQALGGVVSVGVGFFNASGPGVGGGVSIGFGDNSGYSSIGINAQITSGLTFGVNADTEGNVGVNAGFNNNGAGFSVGYNTNGTTSMSMGDSANGKSTSLDISFSSRGVGITGGVINKTGNNITGGGGAGMFLSFNNTVSVGDYTSSSSGWTIPVFVPTAIGIFSASFGKQEFKYWMGINVKNYVTGPTHFKNGIKNVPVLKRFPIGFGRYTWRNVNVQNAFMDINEISINENNTTFTDTTNVAANNMTFPGYDNFSVSGQGVSGSMSAKLYKNGALFGFSGKENKEGYALKYVVNGNNASDVEYLKFNIKPQFDFDNEITTCLSVQPALFNNSSTSNILNYYSLGSTDIHDKARRKTSNFIEYFTNEEITSTESYAVLKANGFLNPSVSGFDRDASPKDGIGGFKVTTIDGKTYHYSLPVYNHEIITRTYGVIHDSPDESQSYFEKRQLEPFATHWVLTAVTGPDFVDNGDGVAGEGDLGYWTSFEYGKWTDAFIWKNPYKKETLIDDKNPNIQTWIRGRKELYYLDKIKTRTHTALFIKGVRQDAPSPQWNYNSADHIDYKQDNEVVNDRFIVPSQKQLKLEKIILLSNGDNTVDKTYGSDEDQTVHLKYNQSEVKEDEVANYNSYDNVLDTGDNWQNTISKAIKVIDFGYDYSLVPGDSRLTLRSVDFKGKAGTSVLPPYKFYYNNNASTFNIDDKDGWGYLANKPETFSLNKIITPQGGSINVVYGKNSYKSVTDNTISFSLANSINSVNSNSIESDNLLSFNIKSNNDYGIELGSIIKVKYNVKAIALVGFKPKFCTLSSYEGDAEVVGVLGNNSYKIKTKNSVSFFDIPNVLGHMRTTLNADFTVASNFTVLSGGCRVASLKVSDGINNYITDYEYGENENGIGYVSYVPYSENISKEVPYSAELPAPRVMYEYVTMNSHKEGIESLSKIRYKFNIMKKKSPDKVKFGSFYEIVKTAADPFVNDSDKDVSINSYTIKENFAALGQLLEVVTLNSKNQLLSKVYSTYYDINEIPKNMGVTQESYQSYKEVDYTDNSTKRDKWVINSSTRIKYPSIIKSSTEQKNGYSYTTEFNDYDLISGISKEQIYTSSDGKSFKTKVIPAYIKYPEMGSKVVNINNKNMLSQTAANYSYILDKDSNDWKITGVGLTTWSNIWSYKDNWGNTVSVPADAPAKDKIWRKHKTYVWNGPKNGDGIFSNYDTTDNGDDQFDWTVPVGVGEPVAQNSRWKQTSEVTLYNHFSAPLEMKDINGNFASSKMGDDDTKVMVTGNAGYGEMFFCGAENTIRNTYFIEPGVSALGSTKSTVYSHTGKYSLAVTSATKFGATMKALQHRPGKYKVSVWAEKTTAGKARISYTGSGNVIDFKESYPAGDWVLKVGYVTVPEGDFSISVTSVDGSTVYFDDLMIRPVASSITGYVYNEWDELSYIIGNNGLATRFEYDAAGRLVKTSVEVIDVGSDGLIGGFKLAAMSKINYKNLK